MCIGNAGLLKSVADEAVKINLDLMRIQKVRWDKKLVGDMHYSTKMRLKTAALSLCTKKSKQHSRWQNC